MRKFYEWYEFREFITEVGNQKEFIEDLKNLKKAIEKFLSQNYNTKILGRGLRIHEIDTSEQLNEYSGRFIKLYRSCQDEFLKVEKHGIDGYHLRKDMRDSKKGDCYIQ